ncbi:MAG TPA: hypothetical protein VF017_05930 [Thermoanaerobaculia bacterium]|nr:hypothetical protein [Thermoanaerobaculia bacterium]
MPNPTPRSCRLLPGCLVALASLLAVAPPAAAEPGVFELSSLNRSYERLAPDIVPIELGGIAIHLSSPRHHLLLAKNRLVLRPLPDGTFDAALQLEFSGQGRLVADIDLSGSPTRIEDELTVPAQRRTLMARVRLVASPEGWLVTPLEMAKTFDVEIDSRLGGRLVALCQGFGILLGGVDCDAFASLVGVARIPLPEVGETYLVDKDRLSQAEGQALDAYLAAQAKR